MRSSTSTASAHSQTAAGIDRRRAAGERLGPLAGVPIAIKDVLVTEGMPSTAGSRILEGWIPPYDATPGAPRARGGHGPARQDQHGRVRDGLVDRALRVRPDPQPVGPRAHPRRLRRRLRGIRRELRGAARARQRHRRLDPPARARHRHRRREAHVRRREPLRLDRARLVARPDRPGHAHRARRGPPARRDRRARPARLDVDPRGLAVHGRRGAPGGCRRAAHRRREGARLRRLPGRRAAAVPRGARAAREAGRRDRRGLRPALRVRDRRVLPDPPGRGVVEPREVRLGAVRPAGERPTAAARWSRSWRPRARPGSAPR